MSLPPPAEKPTIIRIGLVGKSPCATAGVAARAAQIAANTKLRRIIGILPARRLFCAAVASLADIAGLANPFAPSDRPAVARHAIAVGAIVVAELGRKVPLLAPYDAEMDDERADWQ